ncbi:MAG: hypothetical protein JWM91_4447, partial [Rhodospirillales bacterium]|nr:hypothetical protein [Rhodospirillales bacterium]
MRLLFVATWLLIGLAGPGLIHDAAAEQNVGAGQRRLDRTVLHSTFDEDFKH